MTHTHTILVAEEHSATRNFLIDNLGWLRIIRWDIVGPVLLIAAGLLFLAGRR